MSELTVSDTDGQEHFIWLQEADDTCGPACIYMIERMRRLACVVGGEQRITFLTSLLPNGYSEGRGTQSYSALKKVLDRIGIGSAAMVVSNMATFVGQAFFPFIARVGWSGGGGHFVVAVKTSGSGNLVCLDPWYGLVERPLNALPSYSVQENYRTRMSMSNAAGGILSGHVIFPNRS